MLAVGIGVAVTAAATVVALGDDGPSHPDEWDARVVDLVSFVEDERGLDFEHPVAVDFLSADEYAERTRLDAAELDDAALETFDEVYAPLRALGLLPDDFDAVEAGNDLADTGTLAYYDTMTDRITVRGTDMSVDLQVTLVHELVHALQDQHFDIDSMWDDPELTGEESAAFLALLEGDASRIEGAYVLGFDDEQFDDYVEMTNQAYEDAQAELDAVPGVLVASQAAPYLLGPPMVDMLALDGGNRGVDEAFETLPTTTEHVIDVRSYLTGEGALEVDAPAVPVDGEPVGEDDTLGALALFLVLSERVDPLLALSVADGWGGDRFVAYEDDEGTSCLDLAVTGDGEAESAEIAEALRAWAAAGPAGAASTQVDGEVTRLTACEPAEASPPSDVALDALTLPAVRAQVMWSLAAGPDDFDAGFDAADCFVRRVPLDQLVEGNASPDPSPAVAAAIDGALAACGAE